MTCSPDVNVDVYTPDNSALIEAILSILEELSYSIQQVYDELMQMIYDQLNNPCKVVDNCMDKIIEAIDKRYNGLTKTCDECKYEISAGYGGTLEYAMTCAGACIEEVKKCDPGYKQDPYTHECIKEKWQGWCNPETGEVLVLQAGDLPPDPAFLYVSEADDEQIAFDEANSYCSGPPKEKKKKYVAWCNQITGIVVVLPDGDSPPGPEYVFTLSGDDEQLLFEEARQACTGYQQPPQEPSELEGGAGYSAACDLQQFSNSGELNTVLQYANGLPALGQLSLLYKNVIDAAVGTVANIPVAGALAKIAQGAATSPITFAEKLSKKVAGSLGCGNAGFEKGLISLSSLGTIEKLCGFRTETWQTKYLYAMNALCRERQLDPDKAIAAYLGDKTNTFDIDTAWAIHGLCKSSLDSYLKAARAKPIPRELMMLRRREIISPKQYDDSMRELGYLEPTVRENLFQLSEQIPPLSELLMLMRRDTDDEQISRQFDLDALFDQKYGANIKSWVEHQGIPELFIRRAWRAHWDIPAPGQLFEFWQRLRKQKEFGGEDKLLDDIKSALVHGGILPYWHKHYLAVSYRPLGRIDLRRAFNQGSLGDEEMHSGLSQLGYSDENTDRMFKFARQQRQLASDKHPAIRDWYALLVNREQVKQRMLDDGLPQSVVDKSLDRAEAGFENSPIAKTYIRGDIKRNDFIDALGNYGVPIASAQSIVDALAWRVTRDDAVKDFIDGLVSEGDAKAQLIDNGLWPPIAEQLIADADRAIERRFTVTCQHAIRRRFLLGELTANETRDELIKRGTELGRANRLIDWWDCEKGARGKEIAAATLCKWLERGLINATDFRNRLDKLGYKAEDAALIVTDCLATIGAKRLAEAKKHMKEEQAAEAKAARALAQQEALAKRQAAQLVAAQQKAASTKLRRDKGIIGTAERVDKRVSGGLYEALSAVRATQHRLQSDYPLTVDQVIQALVLASESKDFTTIAEYQALADTLAAEMLAASP